MRHGAKRRGCPAQNRKRPWMFYGGFFLKKRTLKLRDKDAWLFEEIDKIVASKKKMAMPTSFEFEVARLLKKGLMGS